MICHPRSEISCILDWNGIQPPQRKDRTYDCKDRTSAQTVNLPIRSRTNTGRRACSTQNRPDLFGAVTTPTPSSHANFRDIGSGRLSRHDSRSTAQAGRHAVWCQTTNRAPSMQDGCKIHDSIPLAKMTSHIILRTREIAWSQSSIAFRCHALWVPVELIVRKRRGRPSDPYCYSRSGPGAA